MGKKLTLILLIYTAFIFVGAVYLGYTINKRLEYTQNLINRSIQLNNEILKQLSDKKLPAPNIYPVILL